MTDPVTDDVLRKRYPVLMYFEFDHLARTQKETSRAFHSLAWALVRNLRYCPETSTALRKLLEAKDCAVRASLPEDPDA